MLKELKTVAEAEEYYNRKSVFGKQKYDPERCAYEVYVAGRAVYWHQCSRKPGYGPNGLFCKQHDPEQAEKRRKQRETEFHRKRNAERPKWYAHEMLRLLKNSKAGITDKWLEARDLLLWQIEQGDSE